MEDVKAQSVTNSNTITFCEDGSIEFNDVEITTDQQVRHAFREFMKSGDKTKKDE